MSALLNLLANCQPHSFEKLTALLSCNDEQLLDEILLLQRQGLQIDTSFGEIKLIAQTPLLNINILQERLNHHIILKPVIDSTNQYLLENITQLKKGDICTAEYQSAGRGRRGRQWISPFASQLMFSFVWQINARKAIEGLSLIIGLAIQQALSELGAKDVMLKWPNDVLLNRKKLAGILIEVAQNSEDVLTLVIGIGINIAVPKQQDIDQPWANLNETLANIDRTSLLIKLIESIYQALDNFEQQGITAEIQDKWKLCDDFFGEEVNIITEKQIISGIEQGIDHKGYLQVAINNNEELLTFNAGEVSLRRK